MRKVRNIIREARGNRNQTEFAEFLGKSQGLVSKYERGIVNPPADILEKCMGILQMNNGDDIDTEILAKRVRSELKAPEFSYARKTIAALLDGLRSGV